MDDASLVLRPDHPLANPLALRARAGRATSTQTRYAAAWKVFDDWCAGHGRTSLPASPETVALYLADRARSGIRPAGLDVELAAIARRHHLAGHPSPRDAPEVTEVRAGIRRVEGTAQIQKDALSLAELRAMLEILPHDLRGNRDRALLLVGFMGGFR